MTPRGYLSLFLTFLRFGCLAWGGPVAQIAMLRESLVEREGWVSAEQFRRALALYQVLPGPEAHELCVYLGTVRAGRIGGLLAGLGFMLPGLVLMLLLSMFYVRYGAATLLPFFAGLAPAVAALIVRATHRIGAHLLHTPDSWIAAAIAVMLTALHAHFALALLAAGMWHVLRMKRQTIPAALAVAAALLMTALPSLPAAFALPSIGGAGALFFEGLKAGLLSFGGAYTVIPFLQESMVGHYPHLTQAAFFDGIALSSVIPAPLVIFGTFLGYLGGGMSGALLMTAGIFLPAFAFTLIGHRQMERLIHFAPLHAFLDGVAAGVTGILALTAATLALPHAQRVDSLIIFSAALAGFYLLKKPWGVPAIILAAGAVGWGLIAA